MPGQSRTATGRTELHGSGSRPPKLRLLGRLWRVFNLASRSGFARNFSQGSASTSFSAAPPVMKRSTSGSRTDCFPTFRARHLRKPTGSSSSAPRRRRAASGTKYEGLSRSTPRGIRSREHFMRASVGPLAADALFVLAGYGGLNAIGFLRTSWWDWIAAVGLSFLTGVIWVTRIGIAFLTVGIPLRLTTFVVISISTAVAGLAVRRGWLTMVQPRRRGFASIRQTLRRLPRDAWIAVPTFVAFAIYAVSGASMASTRPLAEWDAWSIWSRKAEVLFYTDQLPTQFFASSAYTFMHPDYPILLPVFESIQYRAIASTDTRAIHLQFWLLLVAFSCAILYLGFRRGTLLQWLPLAVVVAIVPQVITQLLTAYADIPMALFLALGVLLLGEWLRNGDAKTLAVSVLFLAGSANTKNEGLMAAAVVFVVAGVVSLLGSRRGKTRQLVLGAAAFVAAILPWRIWLAVEGIHGDIPVRKALDPSYLADHASRIWPSAESLYTQLTSASGYYAIVLYEGGWLYAVPLAGALAFVCVFIRECRSLAAFYLASG